ncbi:MAG TPA: hypothetical protein VJ768_05385 [Anaerolineales bacterium]|nr:hypothetical protein [Anaerolineales bacterium]
MKILLIILAIMFLLVGIVWLLQGVDILPGSFMSGQIQWAYAGVVSLLIAAALFWFALRRR